MQPDKPNVCRICGSMVLPKCNKKLDERMIKYYECQRCHFLQAERFDVSKVYKDYFDNHDFGWKQRNKKILKIIDIIVKTPLFRDLRKESKILDFGCGKGYMVRQLKQQGCDAYGYDPFLNTNQRSEWTLYSDLDTFEKVQFDLVICIEVLEHLWYPVDCVRPIIQLLSDRGYLLISTGIYDPNKHNCEWWYLRPEAGHVSIFSKDTMSIFLQKLNLHIVLQISDQIYLARKNSDFISDSFDSILRSMSKGGLLFRKLSKRRILRKRESLSTSG